VINFEWWWMGCLLPLPWLLRWLLPPAAPQQQRALRVPFFEQLRDIPLDAQRGSAATAVHVLLTLMWLTLVVASMRPQWLGEITDLPLTGRDLMLGLDISGSMRERDFRLRGRSVERLDAAKAVADDFISRREGDRVGLILFGDNAQVQTPLTYDLATVRHFLGESVVGLIGTSTAIGDAIGLAVKRLRQRPAESRVLVLLTDGANTAGAVQPVEAARMAAKHDVRVHTIGVGAERVTEEMVEIYQLINDLEPTEIDGLQQRPMDELYIWPLAAALGLSAWLVWRRVR